MVGIVGGMKPQKAKGGSMNRPTDKMIAFAEKIADKLDLEMPDITSFQAVKEFIDTWIDDYNYGK